MPDSSFQTWEEAVRWLLGQPDQQELVRACYYDEPRIESARRFWASEEWKETRRLISRDPGSALDVGAGHGVTSFALAKDGWAVTALEPNPSSLVGTGAIRALAEAAGLVIRTVETFGEDLPFENASFDLVYCRQVLHHARSLRQLCRELFRVLRPSGTLVAAREHVVSSRRQLQRFLEEHPLHRLYGGENAFSVETYRDALAEVGFRDIRRFGPFSTPVNYAPLDRKGIRTRLQEVLRRFPGGGLAARALDADVSLDVTLAVLDTFDRRPGRLHTFVARKAA